MKKIFNIFNIGILICTIMILSCNEDKGNYDYEKVDDVEDIVISGIESEYTVEAGSILEIEPQIKTALGASPEDFNYKWWGFLKPAEAKYDQDAILLSEEKNLHFQMAKDWSIETKTGEAYTFVFEAINKKTGVARNFVSKVNVGSPAKTGYVILTKKAQGFDIDVVALREDKSEDGKTLLDVKHKLITDVFANTQNGLDLDAEPYAIGAGWDITAPTLAADNYAFYVLSSKITTRLNPKNYRYDEEYSVQSVIESWSDLKGKDIIADQVKIAAQAKTGVSSRTFLHYNNNWYVLYLPTGAWTYFDEPINKYKEGEQSVYYTPSPYLATTNTRAFLFDVDNKRFMYDSLSENRNTLLHTTKVNETVNNKMMFLDTDDPNEELVYMNQDVRSGPNYSSNYASNWTFTEDVYAILRGKSGDYRCVFFNASGGPAFNGNFKRVFLPDELTNKNIKIWFKRREILFCVSSDNKFYRINLKNIKADSAADTSGTPEGRNDELWAGNRMLDITPTVCSGNYSEITCIKSVDDLPNGNWSSFTWPSTIEQRRGPSCGTIIVGTKDPTAPAGKNGRVQFFDFDNTENTITPKEVSLENEKDAEGNIIQRKTSVFEGIGEVVDVVYKI